MDLRSTGSHESSVWKPTDRHCHAIERACDGGKVKATLPTALDSQHQKMLDELKAKNGKDFDASYDQTQVKAHQDAVALFDAYAKGGDNVGTEGLGVQDAAASQGASEHGGEAEVARVWLGATAVAGSIRVPTGVHAAPCLPLA